MLLDEFVLREECSMLLTPTSKSQLPPSKICSEAASSERVVASVVKSMKQFKKCF